MTELQNRAWNKKPSTDFFHFAHFGNLLPCLNQISKSQSSTFFSGENIELRHSAVKNVKVLL